MIIRALLLGVCALSGLGLIASGTDLYGLRQAADRGEPIGQPEHWVAFQADIRRVAPTGKSSLGVSTAVKIDLSFPSRNNLVVRRLRK
jgi:hypothetical protein